MAQFARAAEPRPVHALGRLVDSRTRRLAGMQYRVGADTQARADRSGEHYRFSDARITRASSKLLARVLGVEEGTWERLGI